MGITQISFMCPQCKHNQVVDDDVYTDNIQDIKTGDFMVCQHCGAGYTAEVREPFHSVNLLNIEEHEFDNTVVSEPESLTEEESMPAFVDDDNISISDLDDEIVDDVDYINSSIDIEGATTMKYSTLVDKLTKITKSYIVQSGFEEAEAVEYFTVDVSPTDSNEYMSVEVRAELDYDDMVQLSQELNAFIQTIDSDAYFDFVAPGIMTAYLPKNTIVASSDPNKVFKSDYEAALFVCKNSINPKEIKNAQEIIRRYKEQAANQDITASLTNYGGAFDIDPYSFFTREELNELGYAIAEKATELVSPDCNVTFELQDIGFEDDYRTITADFTDYDYDYQVSYRIDMRKITKPNDLQKYVDKFANILVDNCLENHRYD